jgi:HEAT repeat protein
MKKLANKTVAKWLIGCLGVLLISWISYQTPLGRELAVRCLAKTGSLAVPLLRRALQDEDNGVRWAAHDALKELGSGAVPALVQALGDKNARVRVEAAEALSALDLKAKSALPALLAAFNDSDHRVRVKAIEAARHVSYDTSDALPALLVALRDERNGQTRAAAAKAVGVLGYLSVQLATPALIQSLKDLDAEVRAESAEGLGRLARHKVLPEEAIPALREALNDPSQAVQAEAAEALSMAGAREETTPEKD